MGSLDRQTIAFAAAVLTAALGTLALGADAALPSLVGGAAFCALALLSGQAAPLPAAFWLGAATALWLAVRAVVTDGLGLAAPELGSMAGIAGAFVPFSVPFLVVPFLVPFFVVLRGVASLGGVTGWSSPSSCRCALRSSPQWSSSVAVLGPVRRSIGGRPPSDPPPRSRRAPSR